MSEQSSYAPPPEAINPELIAQSPMNQDILPADNNVAFSANAYTDDELDTYEDAFGLDDLEVESSHVQNEDLTFESFAIDPKGTNFYREMDGSKPVNEAEFRDWFNQLPPERQAVLNNERIRLEAWNTSVEKGSEQAHEKLIALVPELYEAKLPEWLAEKLPPGTEYALGFNQSSASSIDDAEEYLEECNGVDVDGYNYAHRFRMFDASMSEYLGQNDTPIGHQIEQGNFGDPSIGRFVAVFPRVDTTIKSDLSIARAATEDERVLPADFETEYTVGDKSKRSVSTKYIAGFIDDEGNFWTNNNFMTDTAGADFALHTEVLQPAQIENNQHVTDLPSIEQATVAEWAELNNEKLLILATAEDPSNPMKSLELAAGERVREIRERAETEGRELNDIETAQIKHIVRTVKESRAEIVALIDATPQIKAEILTQAKMRGTPLTPNEREVLKAIFALRGGEKAA